MITCEYEGRHCSNFIKVLSMYRVWRVHKSFSTLFFSIYYIQQFTCMQSLWIFWERPKGLNFKWLPYDNSRCIYCICVRLNCEFWLQNRQHNIKSENGCQLPLVIFRDGTRVIGPKNSSQLLPTLVLDWHIEYWSFK